MLLGMGQVAVAQRTDLRIQLEVNHLDRITRANARVAAKQASVDSDPAKPIFHLMPAAGSGGDPNGLIYTKGKYHVFFQHSPEFEWGKQAEEWEEGQPGYSNTGWGHASSKDLVYWEHEPIALMPERGSYDPNFCASGCTVIADDGTPTIFYTAAEPQTQCIARSADPNLRWWLKDERNPILREPDVENYVKGGFRDPFIWREGSTWQMIVCGAVQGVGGTVLYFRSDNLTDWKYVKPLCTGMGEHCLAWECPNFLLFGDKGVLIVSPLFNNLQDTDHAPRGAVSYTIASYGGNGDFTPGPWKSIDIGGPNNFYASNALKTPDGRWLLWGMNLGGGAPGHHWATNLSLPRVLTVRPDGLLGQEPPVELQALRGAHWSEGNRAIHGEYPLGVRSNTCEIIAEIEVGDAKVVGLDLRASADFTSKNRIGYDVENGRLHVDGHSAALELLYDEEVLRLHVFVDRSVLEVFVNRRECATLKRLNNMEDRSMRLFSEGGTARIRSVDVWELGSIWRHPAETK
jgi:beta-fructofuranosidase